MFLTTNYILRYNEFMKTYITKIKGTLYRRVCLPDGRVAYEHRYLMELHLGRRLLKSEYVHHKNGDTLDNRMENLLLMSDHCHQAIHNVCNRWAREYDQCVICGTSDPHNIHVARGMCKSCYNAHYRESGEHSQRTRRPKKRWAKTQDCCSLCHSSERPHHSHGLCRVCRGRVERASKTG